MYETQLSIVIVNYNVKYFLEQCLYSVRAATQGLETDIYVVDNHSTDQSIAYLRPLFPEVTFIENQENVGFAKANNQAFRICKGEYVLMLNPDTVIGEESLRSLYFFMEDHPEAGALGLKMLNGNGVFLAESKRSFPTPGFHSASCSDYQNYSPTHPSMPAMLCRIFHRMNNTKWMCSAGLSC